MTTTDVASEIIQRETERTRAAQAQDRAKLTSYIHDDLHYVHSTGLTQDKAAYLDHALARARRQDRVDLKVTVRGDTAIVTGKLLNHPLEGNDPPVEMDCLQIWFKDGGDWKLANHQTTVHK